MAPVLELSNLQVRFRSDDAVVHAVNGIDMSIDRGKTVAIVGESGSGKSTVMMAVMRLLQSNADIQGKVLLDGRDLLTLAERDMRKVRGKDIAMIFQNPSMYLNPTKTIGQQMIEPMLYHHMANPKTAKEKAIQLMRLVGLPDPEQRYDTFPFELSGGQLQRVMIGMSLMTGPKLLIADEPTTALDVTVQAEVLVLLKKLQRDLGMSLAFITHDLAVAAQIADDIYVMYGGMIMEHIRSKDLMNGHAHPYLHGLLQSIPTIDGSRQELPYIPGQPVKTTGGLPDGCVFAERCTSRFEKCSVRPPLMKIDDSHRAACWLVPSVEGVQ